MSATGWRSGSRSTEPTCGRWPTGCSARSPRPTTPCRTRGCGSTAADAAAIENLGGWLTTVVARISLNMLRAREHAPRGAARGAPARADHRPCRRHRPGARGAAGGRRGARAARRTGDAQPGRAARVRAARHVRRAVRRDRADRRPLAGGGAPARQPGAPARARPRTRSPTPTWRRSAKWSTPSSRPRAKATSRGCSRCSTPTSCCGRTSAARRALAGDPRGGGRGRPGADLRAARRALRPALVNGVPGGVALRDGELFSVAAFTVRGGRIVEMDFLADPARLRELDLTVLDD